MGICGIEVEELLKFTLAVQAIYSMLGAEDSAMSGEMTAEARTAEIFRKMDSNGTLLLTAECFTTCFFFMFRHNFAGRKQQ